MTVQQGAGGKQLAVKALMSNRGHGRDLLAACCPLPTFGLVFFVSILAMAPGYAQVGPAEILNPQLKAAEQAHLDQMLAVNREVAGLRFPFTFALSRYAGLSPKEQIGADARGLEFVHFHNRLVLKLTGNYNAAYSADILTANQRASRLFNDVVVPVLRVVRQHFTPDERFDAFGFEIAYHVRTHGHGFGYEGKEILALVMDKSDALNPSAEGDEAKRQQILNRSEIYLNGKPFGLALGMRDPFDTEALKRPERDDLQSRASRDAQADVPRIDPRPPGQDPPAEPHSLTPQLPKSQLPSGDTEAQNGTGPAAIPLRPEPDILQKKYQPQLDALAAEGVAKHHFVDYAPPSFVMFRGQVALQVTLRNPSGFNRDATSIYKRAAQSFDLFLAPRLKPILDKIPDTLDISSLDATVIDQLETNSGQSSEALEFILPLPAARRFVDYEITNQQLLDQSIVLVNGVRIAINLQAVE